MWSAGSRVVCVAVAKTVLLHWKAGTRANGQLRWGEIGGCSLNEREWVILGRGERGLVGRRGGKREIQGGSERYKEGAYISEGLPGVPLALSAANLVDENTHFGQDRINVRHNIRSVDLAARQGNKESRGWGWEDGGGRGIVVHPDVTGDDA